MKSLPNILTGARLLASLGVLIALVMASGSAGDSAGTAPCRLAFVLFVAAAVTDFFDGWLARKMGATSLLGAILDPIADKVLVAAAIVGVVAVGERGAALPGGLILFREFAVSALREGAAPKGIKIPVTLLAKWKTTLQMVAIFAELLTGSWTAWGLSSEPDVLGNATTVAHVLLWIAAAVTFWTGAEYWHKAHVAIGDN